MIAILALNQRNPLLLDPTRTTAIRRAFMADMKRRFLALRKAVTALIVEEDAFGIKKVPNPFGFLRNAVVSNTRWQFLTNPAKLRAFQTWFKDQVDKGVLEIVEPGIDPAVPWTAKFVTSAYQRGVTRAFIESKKRAFEAGADFFEGTKDQFLEAAFTGQVGTAQIEMLATRSFEQLKGVTQQMSSNMSRVLAQGFSEGRGPREIARNLNREISELTRRRALAIARTEVIHAHAEGSLDSFELAGVEGVTIFSEWSTTGDDVVCPLCLPLEGVVMTTKEARGLLPRHPNCIVGDSIVTAIGAKSLMRTKYTGEVLKFVTANGREFSVTPNHVLLTDSGFVTARLLQQGDNLVGDAGMDTFVEAPKDDAGEASIADVFRSLAEDPSMLSECMPLAPEDLHDEGRSCDSEIDVVRPNGELRNQLDIMSGHCFHEAKLPLGQSVVGEGPLTRICAVNAFLHRVAFAFDGSMGVCRDGLALLLGHLRHANEHGLPPGPGDDPVIQEPFVYSAPGDTELLRESVRAHPVLKEFEDLLDWQDGSVSLHDPHSRLIEAAFDRFSFDSVVASNGVAGYSGLVHLDSIVKIESRHVVDLPVYDLSTDSTLYTINGIISSNCRCALLPAFEGDRRKTRKTVGDPKSPINREILKGRKTSRKQIEESIIKSIRAEGRKGLSTKEAFERTPWGGADRSFRKKKL